MLLDGFPSLATEMCTSGLQYPDDAPTFRGTKVMIDSVTWRKIQKSLAYLIPLLFVLYNNGTFGLITNRTLRPLLATIGRLLEPVNQLVRGYGWRVAGLSRD